MRFEARRVELSNAVVQAAIEASQHLGYSAPYPPPSPLTADGSAVEGSRRSPTLSPGRKLSAHKDGASPP
jgi:hypothetical protein